MPCTGLGLEARGFETFTRECAAALRGHGDLEITVFGGGGALEPSERATWNLPRSSGVSRALAGLFARDAYFIEQVTFFAGFLPALMRGAPDIVYFADLNLGNALWHWRRLARRRYRLLYYNGGATTRPFTRCDFVQQVSPEHLASAIARGERAERQVLLPHGLAIERDWRPADAAERARTRRALGVPESGLLLLSVGALSASEKRMDAVIRAVALLPAHRPHLLLLGAETPESARIRALAADALGADCTIRTVPRAMVLAAYRAADAFVLASLREGFGLVQVEALEAGLPCVVHDTPTSAFVLGSHGTRTDLSRSGALTAALTAALDRVLAAGPGDAQARHDWAWEQFSWERLAPHYVEMVTSCADGRRPAFAEAT